ncbi:hypothetical protein R1sor_017217 [Riccia sorocarpa]|uniref:EXS domain-containing protein n=1 Tax=Riccia sorocarpa TaxID=122646 RepID=A0ABD3I660_9MARC
MAQTNPSKQHLSSDSVWKRRIWWLQSFILSTWIFLCFKTVQESFIRADEDVRTRFLGEVFLYYNPMFMVVFVLWLWGVNLWVFSNARISYAKVFEMDPNHLTHREVWKISGGLTMVVLTSMSLYMYFYSRGHLNYAAGMPLFLYCGLPLFLGLPFNICHGPSRFFFLNALGRIAFPKQPITFADFFIADVLTSMAKVFSDMERAVCTMFYYQVAKPQLAVRPGMCGSESVLIPFILAFPYACRFFQCLRQYSDTKDRSCIFNALKYATAFPVIGLSALKYHIVWDLWLTRFRPLWLLFSLINSCYSYYWDISRDWDFGCLTSSCQGRRKGYCLRQNLYFSKRWVYYWAISSNLVLRGAWTYKLSAHLRDYRLTAFAFSALEIVRRFQWIFFRVENEYNRLNMRGFGSQISLKSMPSTTPEKEGLLASTI